MPCTCLALHLDIRQPIIIVQAPITRKSDCADLETTDIINPAGPHAQISREMTCCRTEGALSGRMISSDGLFAVVLWVDARSARFGCCHIGMSGIGGKGVDGSTETGFPADPAVLETGWINGQASGRLGTNGDMVMGSGLGTVQIDDMDIA
jgi:hypothetical protein